MTAFPIENLTADEFAIVVRQQEQELADRDRSIAFLVLLHEDMEAHGHDAAGEALLCLAHAAEAQS